MTTDKTPAQIAGALSEDGLEAFGWVGTWSAIAPYRNGAKEIERLGLVQRRHENNPYPKGVFEITPLGLAVRAELEKNINCGNEKK